MQDLTQICNKTITSIISLYKNGEFASLIKDGKIQTKYTPVEWKLAIISTLLTVGKILSRHDAIDIAENILNALEKYKFSDQSSSCLVMDDKSFTPWNAWLSIIHFKLNNITQSEMYLSSLLRDIQNPNYISAYSLRLTPDDIFSENHKIQSPCGIIILSLLSAYSHTEKNCYLLSAKAIANLAISKNRFDPHDIWAMRILYDHFKEPEFKLHAEYILSQTDNVSYASMASLVASMVQQSNLAWVKYIPSRTSKCKELLKYQISLQCPDGSFARSANNKETRIDYSYQNLLSIIQYEMILKNPDIDNRTLINISV